MKKSIVISLLAYLSGCHARFARRNAVQFCNEDPGKGKGIDPATGKSFDYRDMVMKLLGVDANCDDGAFKTAYNTAMATEIPEEDKAIKSQMQKANEQAIADRDAAKKLADDRAILLANLETRVGDLVPKADELKARAERAEAAFANERNAHIETVITNAIFSGKVTKAESETHKTAMANAKSPVEYDAAVKALNTKKPSLEFQRVSAGLERTIAPGSASSKYTAMVNEAWDKDKLANGKRARDFQHHWNACKNTEAGKSLFESMKQPMTEATAV